MLETLTSFNMLHEYEEGIQCYSQGENTHTFVEKRHEKMRPIMLDMLKTKILCVGGIHSFCAS